MLTSEFRLVLLLSLLLIPASEVYCQLPFYTDDADVTDKGKFHIEFSNEHGWLQKSSDPAKRQNTSIFTINYGLTERIEVGLNTPFIKIFNARASSSGSPSGVGDIQLGMKVKIREERDASSLPAMSIVFYVDAPTGSSNKQIGSGATEYWLYGVVQKSLTERTVGRLNGGILFAGSDSGGPSGIQAARGQVFTANGSLVREFSPKLKLGVELFGGVTNNFNLGRGQLEAQVGGTYAVREDFAFTFGVLAGRFPASPRLAIHVGAAYDFE